MGGVTGCCFC